MSSLTQDPSTLDHHYQSSDASDHGLLTHTCTCCKECIERPESPKTDHIHHCMAKTAHHVHTLNHAHLHLPHHHPPSPKTNAQPPRMVAGASCTCHLKTENEQEIRQNIDVSPQGRKQDEDRIEISPLPPALPPRPPPRPRYDTSSFNGRYRPRISAPSTGGVRKYVFWCCACGGLATILGALFLAVYFLLRTYTSTLGYFETIPTFVPATMLIMTGLCVMSLARKKNRYSYLIKVCGLCCLVCALTCVLVTITTTVIHMNRLQTLRECVYTQKTRTCTCYSVLLEAQSSSDDGMRYVFDSTPDCEVIHGALYSCLRAMFGLSVSGILVCIFSCMLVYQLLSHEKKKMYWEQLELRCRSFYQPPTAGSIRGPPSTTYCSCCEECRYSSATVTTAPQVYPWDNQDRFWTPGRVGNFYSPNPEDVPPVNPDPSRRGWSWRRLPWSRNVEATPNVTDSQYGFSHGQPEQSASAGYSVLDRPVYVWGPPPPYSDPNSPRRFVGRYHHAHGHESHCHMRRHNKDNYENTTEPEIHQESTDTSSCVEHPVRKVKKPKNTEEQENQYEPGDPGVEQCRFLPRLQGVENAAFQKQETAPKPEISESEVYFADVSSCCNNDGQESMYDEARLTSLQKPVEADNKDEQDEYLQRMANRLSTRSRLPFPLPVTDELPKDISQNSLCSVQTPMTDTTDVAETPDECTSYQFLAPDAQYEVIPENTSNLTNTISGVKYYNFAKNQPSRRMGSNISALIQNLGASSGLLYGDNGEGEVQHSDCTMDSGWQSGSEKQQEGVNV